MENRLTLKLGTNTLIAWEVSLSAWSMACALLFAGCDRFPEPAEIDRCLWRLSKEASPAERERLTIDLLVRMSDPQSAIEDAQVNRFIRAVAEAYSKRPDPWVFRAFNRLKMDGGFATTVCGFYPQVRDVRGLLEQIRDGSDGQTWLSKCVGLSLSRDEYARVTHAQDESGSHDLP